MSNALSTFIRRITTEVEVSPSTLHEHQNKQALHVLIQSNNSEDGANGFAKHDYDKETGSEFQYVNCQITANFGLLRVFLSNRKYGDDKVRLDDYKILNGNRALKIGDIYIELAFRFEKIESGDEGHRTTAYGVKSLGAQFYVVNKLYKNVISNGTEKTVCSYVAELRELTDYSKDREASVEVKVNTGKVVQMIWDTLNIPHYRTQLLNNIHISAANMEYLEVETRNSEIYQGIDFIGPMYHKDIGDSNIILEVDKKTEDGYVEINLIDPERKLDSTTDIKEQEEYQVPNIPPKESDIVKQFLSDLIKYDNVKAYVKEKPVAPSVPDTPKQETTESVTPPVVEDTKPSVPLTPATPVAPVEEKKDPVVDTPPVANTPPVTQVAPPTVDQVTDVEVVPPAEQQPTDTETTEKVDTEKVDTDTTETQVPNTDTI